VKDWHQSGIEDYWICGERYRRNHVTGEVSADSASNLMGKAVHEAMAWGLKALKDNGELVSLDQMAVYASDVFYDLVGEDEESEDPIPWGEGVIDDRAHEANVMASSLWESIPGLLVTYGEPLSVEQSFSGVPVTPTAKIAGTWDLLTEDYYILDWKTSRNSWRPGDEFKKIQPVVYARGVEHVTGKWPEGFIYVVVNRRGDVRVKPVPVPKEKLVFLQATLDQLERARQSNIYPMNPTSGLCSETYCTWFRRGCPAAILKGAA